MSDRSGSMARLQFLGEQRITIGSEIMTPEAERLFAMIVRLSVPIGRLVARQTMLDAMWPGVDETNARHNLRQTVYKARELGLAVESGEDGLRLDPREWSCDWDDPVGGVKGQWLLGYEPAFSAELRTWVSAQRETVHGAIRPRIIRELQAARASGDLVGADLHAQQLLIVDELNEEATLTRAETLVMQGAKVDALRLLDAYEREVGKLEGGREASFPAQLLRRRIAEKLPVVSYQGAIQHHGVQLGRASEFKALLRGVFEMRAGRGGGFVITGAEGSGKSRMLHEIYSAALLQNVITTRIVFSSLPETQDGGSLKTLVAQLLMLPGSIGVSPDAYQLLHAFSSKTPGQETGVPTLEIEDLLNAIADEKPLLLLVDGAEYMDARSLETLDAVYRLGMVRHHMMVAAMTTPSKVALTANTPSLSFLSLSPLSIADVRDVIAAFAAKELPLASLDLIGCAAVYAEGVPMYGIEMLGLMLDHGSPDTIPWRVQVAAGRGVAFLNEIERRVLVLCAHLRNFATLEVLLFSLRCETDALRVALTRLESFSHVEYIDGIVRASQIISAISSGKLSPHDLREDARHAAETLAKQLDDGFRPDLFFAALRLMIAAKQESAAEAFLDKNAGALARSDTAPSMIFELTRIRGMLRARSLRQMIDGLLRHISAGAQTASIDLCRDALPALPSSVPLVSPALHELERKANGIHFPATLGAARDPSRSAQSRVTEAVMALAIASDNGDNKALDSAMSALNAVRHFQGENSFELHRGDLIYAASTGNRKAALTSATFLADACRDINDIQLSCKGMRNAAQVLLTFGEVNRAQALLLESRDLADRLGYIKQVAWTDVRLADLALETMDLEGAGTYIASAAALSRRHEIETPMLLLDLEVQRCWAALLDGNRALAAKAARSATRQSKRVDVTTGTALWTLMAVKLATHSGQVTEHSRQSFTILCSSIGSRIFYPNEHFSLAGMLLFSAQSREEAETRRLTHAQLKVQAASGRVPWRYILDLLKCDS